MNTTHQELNKAEMVVHQSQQRLQEALKENSSAGIAAATIAWAKADNAFFQLARNAQESHQHYPMLSFRNVMMPA